MLKKITLLLFLCSAVSFGQNVTIKGQVTDPDNYPLESATIYLTSVKDSTVIDYTISDKKGNWEIRTRSKQEPVNLKISFIGFSDFRQKLNNLTQDKDFGILKMSDNPTELNEVVIKNEIPPIRIKSDTLEFNASSFKVRPDSNVQTLLKQLPGVDIDSDGKITVNGKEVNQILVNGKPFFDKDGKVALQNLPAEIIDKVQVTDTKTKKEELTGKAASGDNASINLTIQKDKNKGFFGKFMGGYGTDDRYESSALVNYFKDKRKISILASSNNINSSGFSMNEIFDSMGGGRNNSIYTTSSGAFSINGMRFGGGNGITQSNMLGINYADEWVDNLESNMSYFYTSADTENNNKSKRVTFLTENDGDTSGTENSLITESSSTSDTDRYAHNFNTQFEFEIDSTSTIYFDPKFVKANSKGKNTSLQSTRDQDDILLNNSDNSSFSNNDNTSFSSSFDYSKSFIKKGRYINFYFENENRLDDGTTSNKSTTNFYDSDNNSTTIDERDQVNYNRQIVDRYEFMAEYSEPITDSLNILATLNYRTNRSTENRNSFDFNETTNEYTELNDLLTNYSTSRTHGFNPEIGFEINKDKYSLNLSSGIRFLKFDNNGTYRGDNYAVNKNYTLPSGWANFSYKFSKSKSTYLHYSYSVDFPQARQVLDIEDISNPLHTMSGNPDLDPNKSHYFYVTFRDFDYATRSGYNFFGGGNIYDSRVVSTTLIDESAKRTTTYTNVSGTYNTWFGGYWNKSVKTENHKYRFNLGFSAGFDLNKGYTNGELYEAKGMRLSPRFNFTWEYGDLLTINPSYNFTYRETDYTNYTIESTSFTTHQFNLRTTSYWPKHVVFGNDFGYNYNSNLGDGFKRDFFLWNTSVGYNFLNDKLLFKVKVYDVLNQNLGTSRNVTATSILDQQNTVLKRYMMFSLTYKIEKFGGKKKEDKGNRFWWF